MDEVPEVPGSPWPLPQHTATQQNQNNKVFDVLLLAPKDGSEEFWKQELFGVVDDEDLDEVSSLLVKSGFKKRHLGRFTREHLKAAGLNQGFIKDILEYQGPIGTSLCVFCVRRSCFSAKSAPPNPLLNFPMIIKIPEDELTIGDPMEDGGYVRATWSRSMDNVSLQVAVAVIESGDMSNEMLQSLAAIYMSPHQNILTLYGVCDSIPPKFVYELMSSNLAKLIQEKRLNTYALLLQVLRDVAAGLAHLHSLGVPYYGLKPSNVLIRKEQVKLCDAGVTDSKAADEAAYAMLLFECVTGKEPDADGSLPEFVEELKQANCDPVLLRLFVECNADQAISRPTFLMICNQLQTLIVDGAMKNNRLNEVLKLAESQDREIYDTVWKDNYGVIETLDQFLDYVRSLPFESQDLAQPIQLKGPSAFEELSKLADLGGAALHQAMQQAVQMSRGKYDRAPRKSEPSCLAKAQDSLGGDYSRLLDIERATGVFEEGNEMSSCLEELNTMEDIKIVRIQDCFNTPFKYGKRALVLNLCETRSGLIGELVLTFSKLAAIKSQSVKIIEISRRGRC